MQCKYKNNKSSKTKYPSMSGRFERCLGSVFRISVPILLSNKFSRNLPPHPSSAFKTAVQHTWLKLDSPLRGHKRRTSSVVHKESSFQNLRAIAAKILLLAPDAFTQMKKVNRTGSGQNIQWRDRLVLAHEGP